MKSISVEQTLSKRRGDSVRVLVIEENLVFGAALSEKLGRSHRVDWATSLSIANQFLERAGDYDVILCDAHLLDGSDDVARSSLNEALRSRVVFMFDDSVSPGAALEPRIHKSAPIVEFQRVITRASCSQHATLPVDGRDMVEAVRQSVAVPPGPSAPDTGSISVLVVDDDPRVLECMAETLRRKGHVVLTAASGRKALGVLEHSHIEVVISDVSMPDIDGVEFLRTVHASRPEMPVILVTGEPTVNSALAAFEHGALHYLSKPFDCAVLERCLRRVVAVRLLAEERYDLPEASSVRFKAGLGGYLSEFDGALQSIWLAFQPIVSAASREVFGYEALLRNHNAKLESPLALLRAAEQLGRLDFIGQTVRRQAAEALLVGGTRTNLFVNLHPEDFFDPTLFDERSPLSMAASNVVLEVTERASMDQMANLPSAVASLRKLGYRIAIDDLGAGYSGLNSFTLLEPDIVKLDMSLTRGVQSSKTKQKLVRSMTALCADLGITTIAEGVETTDERNALVDLGCDLLQGYYFARPTPSMLPGPFFGGASS